MIFVCGRSWYGNRATFQHNVTNYWRQEASELLGLCVVRREVGP